ncbi:hypothetical protein TFLX_02961 [Thermoflexales bacterium]|nr:hypothetical protein TFLX_02961 [Thermoflexales bacterium]
MSRLGRCAFVAVILLLLISVLFNIFLLNRARQYYLDLNAVRLNPLDLDAYQITSSAPSTKP